MTRVNLIDPVLLTDQHLVAERLELNFVISSAKRSFNSKNGLRVTPAFTLGTGHVSFFHDKLGYIIERYKQLTNEMLRRNMKPNAQLASTDWAPTNMMKDYTPTKKDFDIIKERIYNRIMMKPHWYRYEGEPIESYFMENYK